MQNNLKIREDREITEKYIKNQNYVKLYCKIRKSGIKFANYVKPK